MFSVTGGVSLAWVILKVVGLVLVKKAIIFLFNVFPANRQISELILAKTPTKYLGFIVTQGLLTTV